MAGAGGQAGTPSFCRICPRICTQTDCTRTRSLLFPYRQVPVINEGKRNKCIAGLEFMQEYCGEIKPFSQKSL